jgi:hypothetical protein
MTADLAANTCNRLSGVCVSHDLDVFEISTEAVLARRVPYVRMQYCAFRQIVCTKIDLREQISDYSEQSEQLP